MAETNKNQNYPALKEQFISGHKATLFRDGPHPIYLLPDGRFAIMWSGQWAVRNTLKTLEKLANINRPSLKIFFAQQPGANSSSIPVVDAAEFLDSKIVDKDGKRYYKGWDEWYVYDPETHKALVELDSRRYKQELENQQEWLRIVGKTKMVNVGNFKSILSGDTSDDDE